MEWLIHKVILLHAEDVMSAMTGNKARVALISGIDLDALLRDFNLRSPVGIRMCGFAGALSQEQAYRMLNEQRDEWAQWRLNQYWFDIPLWQLYQLLERWGINTREIQFEEARDQPDADGLAHFEDEVEDRYVQRDDPFWILKWHRHMVEDERTRNYLYQALVQSAQFQEWYVRMGCGCDYVYEWPLFCDWWYSTGARVRLYRAFKNWLLSAHCSHHFGRKLDAEEARDPMAAFEQMVQEREENRKK